MEFRFWHIPKFGDSLDAEQPIKTGLVKSIGAIELFELFERFVISGEAGFFAILCVQGRDQNFAVAKCLVG